MSRNLCRSGLRSRFVSLFLVAGMLAVAACGGSPAVSADGECPTDLAGAIASWHAEGFDGVLVVDHADGARCVVAAGTLGPGDERELSGDSVFSIGSVSKAFTAAAVLSLEADGQLDRTRPVSSFVPQITGPVGATTIDELLSHRGGVVGSVGEDGVALTSEEAIVGFNGLTVDPAERGAFLYSNAGYSLLAMVVENVSGTEYRELLADEILPEGAGFWDGVPIAAGDRVVGVVGGTAAEHPGGADGPQWATQGNGDLAMSPELLADWTRDLFTGGVIPAAMVERMLEPSVDAEGQGITDGWVRLPADVLGEVAIAAAGGGGTGQNVVAAWFPDSRRTIVMASRSDGVSAESLLRLVGPALLRGEQIPRPADPVRVDADMLADAVGTYVLATGGRFEVDVDAGADDRLTVVPVGTDAVEALRAADAASPDEVDRHETAVDDLLAGRTDAGRDEVAALADDYGELTGVDLLGTTVADGELRTYVRMAFGQSELAGYYSLNRAGGVESVDLAGPPELTLVAVSGGFRVGGTGPIDDAVEVTFADTAMKLDRGDGIRLEATKVDP